MQFFNAVLCLDLVSAGSPDKRWEYLFFRKFLIFFKRFIIPTPLRAEIEIIPMPGKLQGQYQTYTSADLTELNKHIQHKFKTVEEFLND